MNLVELHERKRWLIKQEDHLEIEGLVIPIHNAAITVNREIIHPTAAGPPTVSGEFVTSPDYDAELRDIFDRDRSPRLILYKDGREVCLSSIHITGMRISRDREEVYFTSRGAVLIK